MSDDEEVVIPFPQYPILTAVLSPGYCGSSGIWPDEIYYKSPTKYEHPIVQIEQTVEEVFTKKPARAME